MPPTSELERTGYDELRRRTLLRVFERLLQVRRTFGPVLLCLALWVGLSDTEAWRRITIFVVVGFLCTLIAVDIRLGVLARGDRPQGPPLLPTLFGVAIVQHTLIFVSGGIASPIVPLILPIVFLTGLLAPARVTLVMSGFQLLAMWLWVWVDLARLIDLTPTVFAADGSRSPVLTLSLAVVMSLAMVVTTIMSRAASGALWRMIGEAIESRDAALASRAEQTRTLTTLSGEIAHELKNPLATVKGLAALIERSELPEKSAERMQVLRREVNRMQEILEEFLNFSRPLVPLDLRELELREIVDHVVDLHEGMAAERRVDLKAVGQARLRCDPRKIEQVLLNLVQNALEVAPAGSSIELELRSHTAGAEISVRDGGPGIAEELRGRVFEAGVTGKAEGSGLGLTIARALARQHGGDLELGERRDRKRGCEAILTLPEQIEETTHA